MCSKEEIDEFVLKILSSSYISYRTHMTDRLTLYIRRLEMRLHYPNTQILVPRDFVAHIIGEMNGFFNALSMAGIVTNVANVTFVKDQLSIYTTENICLKITLTL